MSEKIKPCPFCGDKPSNFTTNNIKTILGGEKKGDMQI